ncbi:MAG: hypothetical protein R2686_06085 [Candidatus Nanopelagicales bacterium]
MTIEYPYGTTERILSIIPNVTVKAGFMGFKTRQHSVVITNNRVLFARITVARMKELSQQGREEAKTQGKGRTAQLLSNPHVYEKLVELYQQLGPEGVLADHPANFAVDRATVSKVKLKTTAGPEGGVGSDILILKTTGKTYKVTLGGSKSAAREALESAGLM